MCGLDVSCPGLYTHFLVSLQVYGPQCVSTGVLALAQGSWEREVLWSTSV
jgi:hypothetical protein